MYVIDCSQFGADRSLLQTTVNIRMQYKEQLLLIRPTDEAENENNDSLDKLINIITD